MATPEIPTDHSLGAWKDWWVEAHCACRRRYYPCTLLAERFGAENDVSNVPALLVCQDCRIRPAVALVSEPSPVGFPSAKQRPGILRKKLPLP